MTFFVLFREKSLLIDIFRSFYDDFSKKSQNKVGKISEKLRKKNQKLKNWPRALKTSDSAFLGSIYSRTDKKVDVFTI